MNKCSFSGCTKESFSKGLCGSHYQQQRQGKELKPLQQQFHGLSEKERFMKWVAIQPNGCWKWMGSVMKHKDRHDSEWHGQWRNANGEHELTHRAAWRILVGDIPRKAMVLHRCDVPRCVNPDHLYLGNQSDNVKDMWDRGRARQGVSRGEDHGNAKVTEEIVREIRSSKESGVVMAKRFGISTATLYDIRNNHIWRHVK
jgi:hypothetical protein